MLPAGKYTGTIKNVHTLANARVFTIAARENSVDFGTLRKSDANDDNQMNILESSILSSAYGTVTGDPGWGDPTDFNDSGPHYISPTPEDLDKRRALGQKADRIREKIGPLGFSVSNLVREYRETR